MFGAKAFSADDIPDQAGKVYLVTGGMYLSANVTQASHTCHRNIEWSGVPANVIHQLY
jgi:hypothetical protein